MASSGRHARAEVAAEARRHVEKLSGERFLRATFAYGGELRLHFGRWTDYESQALSGHKRGTWVLGLRATPWVLVANGAILSRSLDEPQHALRQFAELQDGTLDEVHLRGSDLALTLRFDAGPWFMALTEPRHRKKSTLDLWELLTPSGLFVTAGPDGALEIKAAGEPVGLGRTDGSS